MKKKILIGILLITLINGAVFINECFADDVTKKINQKIDKQNKDIIDNIGEFSNMSDGFDSMLDKLESRSKEKYSSFDTETLKNKLRTGLFNLSLESRKFAVVIYMLLIIGNIFLLSTIGSKSLQKRKFYIIGSAILTIVLIIFLNIPLLVLYFKANPMSEILTMEAIYNTITSFLGFLRENSIVYGMVLVVYGILNKILGKNDIPRDLAGGYIIKVAIVMIVTLRIIPDLISAII